MFEAYTLLGALAARTSTVRLGTLVTGVTYRHPAVLAKVVTALDVISSGRALLGIGAAWYDVEHHALGVDFPPLRERYELLVDALRICTAMFTQEQSTVVGTHHSITDAWNVPRPVTPGGPPILIGGSGEKKTFGIAAEYADELNIVGAPVDFPRKLEALDGHLERLGRDRSSISVSILGSAIVGATHEDAEATVAEMLTVRGVDNALDIVRDPDTLAAIMPRAILWGDADEVGEQAQALADLGIDGLVVNLMADPGDVDAVVRTGQALSKVFHAA
ncbi:MAG: LLM class flavin-dependent oxidoreductase [Acidimicrobiales bacterium]